MSFNKETQQKINRFAQEQSQRYLDEAEMTYIEKLRKKTGETKQKINEKLARFKGSSEQSIEAKNDLILYMSDYMEDLMSKGLTEQEAFDMAKEELSSSRGSDRQAELREKFRDYYENLDPAASEAAGFLYGGFSIVGMVIGTLTGYALGGGRQEFLSGGWIDAVIGMVAGVMIGVGLALVGNAVIVGIKRE